MITPFGALCKELVAGLFPQIIGLGNPLVFSSEAFWILDGPKLANSKIIRS